MTFLGGTYALAIAGVLSRMLGAFHRVILYSLLKQEGMGLLQMASPVYFTALSLCTGGIRTATARLVAEREAKNDAAGAHDAFKTSLVICGVLGVLVSCLVLVFSRVAATRITKDSRAALAIAVFAPGVLFEALTAAYRGTFYGRQQMVVPAIAQVTEQMVRTIGACLLVTLLLPVRLEYAVAGAALGSVIGSMTGFFCHMFFLKRPSGSERAQRRRSERTASTLLLTAMPVTSTNLVGNLSRLIEMAVIPAGLIALGHPAAEATKLYGEFSGGALPLATLPAVIAVALGTNLVPAITRAGAKGDTRLLRSQVDAAIRVAFLIGIPATVGLKVLASQIPAVLYKDASLGRFMAVLYPIPALLSLGQCMLGTLQGLGSFAIILKNTLLAAFVQIACTRLLLPRIGIMGAAYAAVAALSVSVGSNATFVSRKVGIRFSDWLRLSLHPTISALLMGFLVGRIRDAALAAGLGGLVTLALSVGGGALIYLLALLAFTN